MSRLTRVLIRHFTHTRLSLFIACFPKHFWFYLTSNWPDPLSLATTNGVSVDILSSGYLDVSVRQVCFLYLCIQYKMPLNGGFPHSEIPGSKFIHNSPGLIAVYHVLHRLLMPRHPLNALSSLELSYVQK